MDFFPKEVYGRNLKWYYHSRREIGKTHQKVFFKSIPFDPTIPFPKMYFKEIRIHERFSYNN